MIQPTLIMLCGPQGSGKSTWAKKYVTEHPDTKYLSTDDIWQSIGSIEDRSIASVVYPILTRRCEAALQAGQSVILDATFVKRAWRKDYVKLGRRLNAKLVAHVFNTDKKTLMERIEKRVKVGGMNIPEEVLDRYIKDFQPPTKEEFDEIVNH
jgi:predicted kinase